MCKLHHKSTYPLNDLTIQFSKLTLFAIVEKKTK